MTQKKTSKKISQCKYIQNILIIAFVNKKQAFDY